MMQNRQLRVCHVASGDLWAGAEVQVAGLLEELSTFPDIVVSALLLNKGKLRDELIARNIPVTIWDETRLNSVQLFKTFYSHFRRQGFDVVHTHRYKENILAGLAAAIAAVPIRVHTIHGLQEKFSGWDQTKIQIYTRLNAMVVKWTGQCIIGVSEEIADKMAQQLPGNVVVCVHNGISVTRVRPAISAETKRRELGIPEDAIIVGAVGRLVPVKGIEYLLRAVRALRDEPGKVVVRLLLVGDGPLRRKLEALAKELCLEQQVLFLGERNDVYDLMNIFDLYALPSRHEGVPMALLEAMALGRPVVASRVGGIPEVVTDMAEGKLVPPQDVDALCNSLQELASSRALRKQFGKAARARITRSYDSKHMAFKVKELYWNLVNESLGYPKELNGSEFGSPTA
jgi:L-malate glycosyltransferase